MKIKETLDIWSNLSHLLQDKLGEISRFYRQELSISVTDEGWLIRIFSCIDSHDDPETQQKINILIPKDNQKAVKITTSEKRIEFESK